MLIFACYFINIWLIVSCLMFEMFALFVFGFLSAMCGTLTFMDLNCSC